MFTTTALLALIGSVSAGTILWDGRLNNEKDSSFLSAWSFSNTVGAYQYYIHGTSPVTSYVNLGGYKNPSDTGSTQGIQITIDNTSVFNNDNMLRTELIPQTTAPINKGKVFYHFSVQHVAINAPSPYYEHQVCFFESHFTQLAYGLLSGEQGVTEDQRLRWDVNGVTLWNATFEAGVWHNIAYAIDFDAQTVGFYHSTEGTDLILTVPPTAVSTSSNGADWHLGVLRLPSAAAPVSTASEDWHFSGVYIESGTITTSISGPGSAGAAAPAAPAAPAASSVVAASPPSSAPAAPAPPASSAPASSYVAPVASSKPAASSAPLPTASSKPVAPASSKPVAPASSKPVAPASSHVAATSSAVSIAPVSASSVAPVVSASSADACPASVAPVATSSAVVAPVPASSALASVPISTPVYSNATAATSAAAAASSCVIQYVYV